MPKLIDLIKICSSVGMTLILILLLNFARIYINDLFVFCILCEIIKIASVILLAKKLLGIIALGSLNGLIYGLIEGFRAFTPEYLILTVAISIITTLISSLSLYPWRRSKNMMFLIFLPMGLFLSIIISYYYTFYNSFWLALLSPFFIK